YSTASRANRLTGQSMPRSAPVSAMSSAIDTSDAAAKTVSDRLAIAGSGAIACGLAATAARHGPVLVLARSEASAQRARRETEQALARAGASPAGEHVHLTARGGRPAPARHVSV